jgi:transcription termination/antitermination protein NusA
VNDADKVMEVIVEDKQLSLAIGKKGQNVRLAAKLTGWKIDIKSEEEKRREVEVLLGELESGEPVESGEGEAEQPGEIQASDAGAEAEPDEQATATETGAAEAEPPTRSAEDPEAK